VEPVAGNLVILNTNERFEWRKEGHDRRLINTFESVLNAYVINIYRHVLSSWSKGTVFFFSVF